MYAVSARAHGNPLNWTGTTTVADTAVVPTLPSYALNIRLGISSVLYVKPAATGKGDGSDWNNALRSQPDGKALLAGAATQRRHVVLNLGGSNFANERPSAGTAAETSS